MSEETLFAEALELPPEERPAFLDEKCGENAELRERVGLLLRSHETAESFLAKPAGEDFEATLDISVDDQALIEERSEELRKSQAARSTPQSDQTPGDHEPPSVNVVLEQDGKRVMYFGDYELQGEIAQGAMGVVYRAEQKSLKRIVAIKMIRSTLLTNDVDVSRFHAEAEAAASLDHPNIVPIYEVGVHEDQHYFSMKLVEGGTLRDRLEPLKDDPKAAARLMSTVAGAIHAAHQHSILHRDLKPGNILIDGQGEPHITDFGLAKQMESNSSVTLSGQIMGTPQYMAPEQAEGGGKELTTAADVYALGAMFYEMICGRPPHQGESLMETLKLVAEEEALPPSRHHPKIDRDLETIAMKCLAKDPSKRYASAQGLKNDLDRWLAGEPILARPVGTAEKVIKWTRRKPMHAAAGGLALLLLLTFGIGGPIKARKERELREQAEIARAEAEANARRIRKQAYITDTMMASNAVEEQRFTKARELLDRHVPLPDEEDIRGFEWHYLWSRTQGDDLAVVGEYEGLRGGIAVSPDSSLVAHNTDTGIEVRDTRTREVIRAIEVDRDMGDDGKPDDYAHGFLEFSPDGGHLLSVKALRVRRWRTDTWEAEPVLEGIGWPLVFSQDGSIVVALSGDEFVVRDGETFEEIRRLEGSFGRARQYDFNSHVTALTPDGDTFFAAEGHASDGVGIVRRWDVSSGEERARILSRFNGPTCLTVSRKGILAASNWKGDVALWDTRTEQFVQKLEPHTAWIPMIGFTPEGSRLVTASADETICIFDIDDSGQGALRARLGGHEDEIWALATASHGFFFTGSKDGTTRLWKIPARQETGYTAFHLMRPIEFGEDSRSLIVWCMEKEGRSEGFYRLDLASGEVEPLPKLVRPGTNAPGTRFFQLHFTNTRIAGGPRIALGSRRKPDVITIWNLQDGREEIELEEAGHLLKNYRWQPFTFSPDGSLFATANETNGIRIWDSADWSHRELVPEFPGRTELCISADNRVLAALPPEKDGEVLAVEIESGRVLARFPLRGLAPEMALSADGRFLAVGSTVREVQLWDLEKGEKIHELRAHVAGIRGLAFSPDGRTLATCGDQRLKLWSVQTGSELMVLAHDVVEIRDPVFSPDGRTLVASSQDKWLRVWRVPPGEQGPPTNPSLTQESEIHAK